MEFLYEYGMFLAKAITFVLALLAVVAIVGGAAMAKGGRRGEDGHIEVTPLNERYKQWREQLQAFTDSEERIKAAHKAEKKQEKADRKAEQQALKKGEDAPQKAKTFVLDFDGDIKASAVDSLRNEITAVLAVAKPEDEVLLRLESGGGMVHSYGLAASQLERLKDKDIPLVIAVDKVAASGGYMMACIADKLLAAPFAIVGSIGVVAQLPNFNKLLKKADIDFEMHTAGEHKRTLTMFGENTDAAREKFREELEDTHTLFKDFVGARRPALDIDSVATGEYWYGSRALEKGLVDELQTSDDYIVAASEDRDVLAVRYHFKKSLQERLGMAAEGAINAVALRWLSKKPQDFVQ